MERLQELSNAMRRRVPTAFHRYLADEIDWDARLIGISGARGSGKTVMLGQRLRQIAKEKEALYVSLDDVYFSDHHLVYFAEDFARHGGEVLLLDEVHKYPNWSQEIKNIYDSVPDVQVIFTSSSALEIHRGSHDLSRRALVYPLYGLSLREFIELKYLLRFPAVSLQEILEGRSEWFMQVHEQLKPLKVFQEYLEAGYYPFFKQAGGHYLKQLQNTVNLVLESDLPAIHTMDFGAILKMKKILAIIAGLVPYKPNIEKLARQVGTTRDTLLKYLYYLEKAQIVKTLDKDNEGISLMNKPEKLYLQNPNLAFALAAQTPDQGNLRETFLLNQLLVNHTVQYPDKGDFWVDKHYWVEVGGRNKTDKQISNYPNRFIAADDLEYPHRNKIPLWMLGFLY